MGTNYHKQYVAAMRKTKPPAPRPDGPAYVRQADSRGGVATHVYLVDGLTPTGKIKLIECVADVERRGDDGTILGMFFTIRPNHVYEVLAQSGVHFYCCAFGGVVRLYPAEKVKGHALSQDAKRGIRWTVCRECGATFRVRHQGDLCCAKCANRS